MARLAVLLDLGLGYLTLERSTPTLSPGELQRLRLATQVRSNLFGVVYVLDEPSAGLHPADTEALLAALDRLKASGNSLFVVEHELDVIRHADWIVDVGPAAGRARRPRPLQRPARGAAEVEAVADARATCSREAPARAQRDAAAAARAGCGSRGVTRNNLHGPRRRLPARRVHDRDRRVGLGQVEPGEPGAGRAGGRAPRPRGRAAEEDEAPELERPAGGAGRRPDRRRDGGDQAAGAWWTRSRSAARRGRTWPPTPGCSTTSASCSPATKAAQGAALRRRPVLVQRRQGPLRDLRGRGVRDGRAALPAERLRALPDLPRRALQREDAGGQVPGQEHRRGAGDDGGRGVGVLRRRAARAAGRWACCGRWGSATCGSASRRPSCPAGRRSGSSWRPSCSGRQRGDTLYVLDEPTTGLHPADVERLVAQLDGLVEAGNTVIVVEHDMRVVARERLGDRRRPRRGRRGGKIGCRGSAPGGG